jgi:methyltransferase (TIGR00027 family)
MRAYIAVRTEFFDSGLLQACERGVGQVVIVGAGYDGRSLRFRQPGVTFYEIDHPATQADKRARLAEVAAHMEDVRFVAADFRQDSVVEALTTAGHDRRAATHFMAEGLTSYLPSGFSATCCACSPRWRPRRAPSPSTSLSQRTTAVLPAAYCSAWYGRAPP